MTSIEVLRLIEHIRQDIPRNQMVMCLCDECERLILAPPMVKRRDPLMQAAIQRRIEPAKAVCELARPPQRAVRHRQRIMRALARRRQIPDLEIDLDGTGNLCGLRPVPPCISRFSLARRCRSS